MALRRKGRSKEESWFKLGEVAQIGRGGSLEEERWLLGGKVALRRRGGSKEVHLTANRSPHLESIFSQHPANAVSS